MKNILTQGPASKANIENKFQIRTMNCAAVQEDDKQEPERSAFDDTHEPLEEEKFV